MKPLTFFALLLIFLSACSDKEPSSQSLVGSWRYDTEAILDSVRVQNRSESEMAMVQGAMSIYQDAIFNFQEEGELSVVTNGIKQSGTWAFSANGKQLTINLSGQGQPNEVLGTIPPSGAVLFRWFPPARPVSRSARISDCWSERPTQMC